MGFCLALDGRKVLNSKAFLGESFRMREMLEKRQLQLLLLKDNLLLLHPL